MLSQFNKKIRKTIKNSYLHLTEFPLKTLHDRPAQTPAKPSLIPPMIYQTWLNDQLGKTHLAEIEKFRASNLDLSFVLYTQENLERYMSEHWASHPIYPIFQNALFGPLKTDIFRYCILYERGGYYFDINKGCHAISSLVSEDSTGIIAFEMTDCLIPPSPAESSKILYLEKYVLQWGMGFAPKNIILERLIHNICELYPFYKNKIFKNPKNAIMQLTGPGMFTKTVREVLVESPDINIIQADIDFHGQGIFKMKKAEVRYFTMPAYTDFKNQAIVT